MSAQVFECTVDFFDTESYKFVETRVVFQNYLPHFSVVLEFTVYTLDWLAKYDHKSGFYGRWQGSSDSTWNA